MGTLKPTPHLCISLYVWLTSLKLRSIDYAMPGTGSIQSFAIEMVEPQNYEQIQPKLIILSSTPFCLHHYLSLLHRGA